MEKTKSGNRRLIAIGGSVGVTLPCSFLKAKGWKAGDRVSLVYDDITVIVRIPKELRVEIEGNDCRTDSRPDK